MARAEVAMFAWIESRFPRIASEHNVQSLRELRIEYASRNPHLWHDLTEVRYRHLCEVIDRYGYRTEKVREGIDVFLTERNKVKPFEDVDEALARLKQDYVLVSLTNGNASVEQSSLAPFFSINISSSTVGAAKPDERIYRSVCEKTGANALTTSSRRSHRMSWCCGFISWVNIYYVLLRFQGEARFPLFLSE